MFSLLFLACGGAETTTVQGVYSERFVGDWLISSSGYPLRMRFKGDGSVEELSSDCNRLGPLFCSREVHFSHSGDWPYTYCFIDGPWRSVGDDRLIVEARCEDEVRRDLTFVFPAQGALDDADTEVKLVSIGDYPLLGSGSTASKFGSWRFHRCADRDPECQAP